MWAGAFQVVVSATAVLGVTFFMYRQISRESAATRSALLRCALLAVLAVPFLTAILPRWEVPGWEARREFDEARVSTQGRPPEYRVTAGAATALPARGLHVRIGWTWILVVCWSGGAALVCARFMLGTLAARRIVAKSHVVDSRRVTALAEAATSFFALRRRPCIRETDLRAGPAVAGILQPAILLPSGWTCWGDTTIRAVVLHETAHILRRDPLFLLVGAVARALYWPHPGIWWLTRASVREAEFACDEMVLSTGADPLKYADGLVRVARDSRAPRHHWLSAAARMAGRTSLEARINRILDNTRAHEIPGRKWIVAGVPLLLAAVCSAAGPDATNAAGPISTTTRATEASKPATDVPQTHSNMPLTYDASDTNAVAAIPRNQPTEYATHPASFGRDESALFQPDEHQSSDASARRAAVGDYAATASILLHAADSAVQLRWQAASTIGLVEPAGGIDLLLGLLSDRHPRVRETAAWALGEYESDQLEEAGAIDRLVVAASDPDAGVRRQVAAVFGLHEPEGVIPALVTLLDDTSARVRATTVWAAGEQRRRDLTEHLLAYADDVDARVRVQVARALARLPDRAWRPTLLQLAEDIDPEVRAFAALALEQLEN